MRKTLRLLLVIVAVGSLVAVCGIVQRHSGRGWHRVVKGYDISSPHWSRDGRYIYYYAGQVAEDGRINLENPETVVRYDTATGKRQEYDLRSSYSPLSDIPDNRFRAFTDWDGQILYYVPTGASKPVKIYSSKTHIQKVQALPNGTILFTQINDNDLYDIYTINPTNRRIKKLLGGTMMDVEFSGDGRQVLYQDTGYRYHLHDLSTGKDRLLNFGKYNGRIDMTDMLYFCADKIIFNAWDPFNPVKTLIYDLDSGKMRQVAFPKPASKLRWWILSPDLKKCFAYRPSNQGDFWSSHPAELYVLDLPPKISKQLMGK